MEKNENLSRFTSIVSLACKHPIYWNVELPEIHILLEIKLWNESMTY